MPVSTQASHRKYFSGSTKFNPPLSVFEFYGAYTHNRKWQMPNIYSEDLFKGTVRVISSDSPCKKGCARFLSKKHKKILFKSEKRAKVSSTFFIRLRFLKGTTVNLVLSSIFEWRVILN